MTAFPGNIADTLSNDDIIIKSAEANRKIQSIKKYLDNISLALKIPPDINIQTKLLRKQLGFWGEIYNGASLVVEMFFFNPKQMLGAYGKEADRLIREGTTNFSNTNRNQLLGTFGILNRASKLADSEIAKTVKELRDLVQLRSKIQEKLENIDKFLKSKPVKKGEANSKVVADNRGLEAFGPAARTQNQNRNKSFSNDNFALPQFATFPSSFSNKNLALDGGMGDELGAIASAMENIKVKSDEAQASIRGTGELTAAQAELAGQFGSAFTNAFDRAVFGGGKLKDVLRGLARDLALVVVRAAATKAAGAAISSFAFDKGGIMTGGGPVALRRFASGGVATSPTLALFGEGSRNEAFVPLPDGRRIPVRLQGGGGGLVNNFNANVSVKAKGGDPAQNEDLARRIGEHVQNSMRALLTEKSSMPMIPTTA